MFSLLRNCTPNLANIAACVTPEHRSHATLCICPLQRASSAKVQSSECIHGRCLMVAVRIPASRLAKQEHNPACARA